MLLIITFVRHKLYSVEQIKRIRIGGDLQPPVMHKYVAFFFILSKQVMLFVSKSKRNAHKCWHKATGVGIYSSLKNLVAYYNIML